MTIRKCRMCGKPVTGNDSKKNHRAFRCHKCAMSIQPKRNSRRRFIDRLKHTPDVVLDDFFATQHRRRWAFQCWGVHVQCASCAHPCRFKTYNAPRSRVICPASPEFAQEAARLGMCV